MYESQHYLRGYERVLFSQTWRKSAVGDSAKIVRGRRTFPHEFCWRSNFTRRGDFNVRLSSIVYYQAHEFYISAEVFRRSFPQKFSAAIFRRSFPQQFSAEVFRSKFPPKFSAWILGIRHNFHETQKFHVFVIF